MRRILRAKSGFTLIELLVVIAIIGILASLAIPSFLVYLRRSKTGEAPMYLSNMFKAAATYYSIPRSAQGITSTVSGACTVASAAPSPTPPRKDKQPFSGDQNFKDIGFAPSENVYYEYSLISENGQCGNTASDTTIYTLVARGDLDGDGEFSTFEIAVGSSSENVLYKAKAVYVVDEYE